jgi:hypothetical protein
MIAIERLEYMEVVKVSTIEELDISRYRGRAKWRIELAKAKHPLQEGKHLQ